MVSITGDRLVIGAHDIPVWLITCSRRRISVVSMLDFAGWNTRKQPFKCACPFERISQGRKTEEGVLIGAICAGPMVLGGLGGQKGKRLPVFLFLRANNGRRYPYG